MTAIKVQFKCYMCNEILVSEVHTEPQMDIERKEETSYTNMHCDYCGRVFAFKVLLEGRTYDN